jgi:hypothetical protein
VSLKRISPVNAEAFLAEYAFKGEFEKCIEKSADYRQKAKNK